MPSFIANQARPAPAQAAALSARASFTAARLVPAPAQVARLEPEPFPDLHFAAVQVVPPLVQRPRLVLARWRGPAEPRPPGVPATPRP